MSPPTRTRWADERLRTAILTGEFAPGQRLRAEHLAEVFGVSPTPLREAFQRLAGEGLITIEPQRGARVASIDARSGVELYDIRLALEPKALQASVRASDTQHRNEVEIALKSLESRSSTIAEALDKHRAFHLVLLNRCGNTRLLTLIAQLHDQSERYQLVAAVALANQSLHSHHRAIANAVIEGNVRTAGSALKHHLKTVRDIIERTEP